MLYKLSHHQPGLSIEPVAFKDFSHFGHLEKAQEDLIARNILDVLFEESGLMPIFQERSYQAEADIYALNERAELFIFELKRAAAGVDAVQQLLRYAQEAGRWSFAQLQAKYHSYSQQQSCLLKAHQEAFQLEHPLDARQFNRRQKLLVIGSAADDGLLESVEYWQRQGVAIEFLPYRVYEIGAEQYFEFFALPHDRHTNPQLAKGVLFDTNRSWDEQAIWYMFENQRVAAFGDAKNSVAALHPGDLVFLSHPQLGVVGAAKVRKGNVKAVGTEELYRDVEFITPVPKKGERIHAMPFGRVTEFTGKSFFWARTIKVPYLSKNEADQLLIELQKYLQN
ncbi:MAG: DUF91 domain-containing protein [Rheinheimera sp.]|nr:MAG: DUF91 domain-containing protein [Rheinheimera sp.]